MINPDEVAALRALRKAVDDLDYLMLFRYNPFPGRAAYLGYRVEITIESWDRLMDVIGDLERVDHDAAEGVLRRAV